MRRKGGMSGNQTNKPSHIIEALIAILNETTCEWFTGVSCLTVLGTLNKEIRNIIIIFLKKEESIV